MTHLLRLTALTLGSLLLAGSAQAQQSPYYIGVSAAYLHDDNLLRLGNDAAPVFDRSKSDSVTTTSLLAGFDQHFGRQRGYMNVSLRDSRYQRNSIYNNQGYTGTAGLDWSTAERVSGSLSGTVNRSLASFYSTISDLQSAKNIQNTQALNASISVGLVTEYSFVTTLAHRQLRNSAAGFYNSDFEQDNASFGLRWQPRAQTTLGAALTATEGRYPKFASDGVGGYRSDRFKQSGIELTATVMPSGASTIDSRLSYSKTRYDLNSARDFSGVTGTVGWSWQPRAKLHLNTRYSRDTGQNSYAVTLFDPTNGFTDSAQLSSQYIDTFRTQADYDITGKIGATAALQYTKRALSNSVEGNSISGRDTSTIFQLGVRWLPLRSVTVGCDLSTEHRTASGAGTIPLKDNTVSCYGQFQLQQ